jgi:septum formation protein
MNLSFTSSKNQMEAQPTPTHIVLASQSLGRRMLLEKLSIRYRMVVTRVDEDNINASDPYKTIKLRAAAKLDEVLKHPRVYSLDEKANNLIIAADSMAIIGKKVYGKPIDREAARIMIKDIMGKTHTFVTSVAMALLNIDGTVKKRWEKQEITKVTLRKMTNPELESYVTRYDFSRFAASYALNEAPWDLVTKIDGSYTNVIGLPFEILLPILRNLEIIV